MSCALECSAGDLHLAEDVARLYSGRLVTTSRSRLVEAEKAGFIVICWRQRATSLWPKCDPPA
jgi:hypothetical protein